MFFSFVGILVPVCLEKPLALMVLLELLEVNVLAWTEVLVWAPVLAKRLPVEREKELNFLADHALHSSMGQGDSTYEWVISMYELMAPVLLSKSPIVYLTRRTWNSKESFK